MTILSKRALFALAAGAVAFGSLALAGTALAAGTSGGPWQGQGSPPGIFGTVASVSGDTLTVTAKQFTRGASGGSAAQTATTYTVDASGATVTKAGASSNVSGIAVGDMVMVQGTVSGTSVTATSIRDGIGPMGPGARMGAGGFAHASTTPPVITGNGEPVVGGSVTAISGDTLTVTAKAGTVYTVDASSATITERGVTGATISNVSVGDAVVVQGTVNGTSVTASSVIDQGAPKATSMDTATSSPVHRFLGNIGGFFSHLFGFF